jgi:predicted NAD-dependent protein-ADP-ribosyltransferase YbiA (DUF1768 family)
MGSLVDCIRKYYPEYLGYSSYPADQCAAFSKSDEEWGILGNMTSAKIVVDGVEFKTSEQLYQMMKFKDPEVVKKVWNGDTARGKKSGNTKMTAKSYELEFRREDWGCILVDAMKFCVVEKYEQCEAFRKELERSRGKYIVEKQPKAGRRADAWNANLVGDKWVGPNLMGRLLMELRDGDGKMEYKLPDDAFEFIKIIKELKK